MIEFVTLILGLVTGEQLIELSVGTDVHHVEVRLDDRSIATLWQEPWHLALDLGDELMPHEVVAVAFDARHRELGRARQWINLPHERAEARLSLDRQAGRGPPRARLVWQALDADAPSEMRLLFDGRPLTVADPASFELPEHDPRSLHFLRAELTFSDSVQTQAELVFGGTYGDEVTTDLTAVVLRAAGRKLPPVERTAGWLRKGDQELRVVAVEPGPVDLILVRERSAGVLEGLQAFQFIRGTRLQSQRIGVPSLLEPGDRVRYVFAAEEHRRAKHEMLPVSTDLSNFADRDLFKILIGAFFSDFDFPAEQQRLADAVTIAGLVAAGGDRRRAVVLITSGESADTSRYSATAARAFLRQLGVPLFVWSLPAAKGEEGEIDSAWGEARDISDWNAVGHALKSLRRELGEQVVMWVDGSHLHRDIELGAQASGVSLLP